MANELVKKTEIKLSNLEDIDELERQMILVETPYELQIQFNQFGQDAFIDLTLNEVASLALELDRFLSERTK